MKEFKFNLGQEVKDKITGFKGIVGARIQYLTGCNRYSVQGQKLFEGRPVEPVTFDEDQLLPAGKGVKLEMKDPGGPHEFEDRLVVKNFESRTWL